MQHNLSRDPPMRLYFRTGGFSDNRSSELHWEGSHSHAHWCAVNVVLHRRSACDQTLCSRGEFWQTNPLFAFLENMLHLLSHVYDIRHLKIHRGINRLCALKGIICMHVFSWHPNPILSSWQRCFFGFFWETSAICPELVCTQGFLQQT